MTIDELLNWQVPLPLAAKGHGRVQRCNADDLRSAIFCYESRGEARHVVRVLKRLRRRLLAGRRYGAEPAVIVGELSAIEIDRALGRAVPTPAQRRGYTTSVLDPGASPTGEHHRCGSEVVYNGHYFCGGCGVAVTMTPKMYAGLFDRRYPDGDFERHPNFDRALYERGKED